MTTLDKIKAEIQKVLDAEPYSENARVQALALFWVLELIDKYAEQEPKWIPVSKELSKEMKTVIAPTELAGVEKWMPLPKPYEPQESEDKE